MLGRLSGRVPSPQVVREFHAETAGNPFFVRELFRHLEAEGRLYDAAGDFRAALKIAETEVPQSVKLLVRSRLDRISTDTQDMLGIAALAGQSFTLEVLQAATKSDRLVESIEQADLAGLVFFVTKEHRRSICVLAPADNARQSLADSRRCGANGCI